MISRKSHIAFLSVLFTAALATVLLYFFVYPQYAAYFPKCIFYGIMGLHCPLCGSQRALIAFLKGDLITAMHDNVLMVGLLFLLIYIFLVFLYRNLIAKNNYRKSFTIPFPAKFILLALIVFGILRNIPLYPFTLLAPLN